MGAQILVNVAMHYPARIRATALGWTLGVAHAGAILGPLLAN
ncbi:MAG TPA: hypothetical protein VJT49_05245 [Amycolatopsis sp.]|nr:hypothetical protein [Amycolatopsis sp.]HKS44513.1 hypothetical protein [Amycolatopsis sp.]